MDLTYRIRKLPKSECRAIMLLPGAVRPFAAEREYLPRIGPVEATRGYNSHHRMHRSQ